MADATEPLIAWQTEEYSHKEKSPDWYWAFGVIAVAGAAIAVIYHNILFAVFIALGAIILGIYAARPPEVIEIAITEDGIRIRQTFYPFAKMAGFAIDRHTLGSFLLIETKRTIAPVLSIPLPDEDLDYDTLETFLETKMERKPLSEPTSHRIMEHLGF